MSGGVSAVLFDLDGTLYHQAALRAAMLAELGTVGCIPRGAVRPPRLWRVLKAFRRVREDLRLAEPGTIDLEAEQYRRTAELAGVSAGHVRLAVAEWIFRRPIKYMAVSRRRGVVEALGALRDRGIHVGVFSDYPTREKLAALGVRRFVTLEVCATDPAVNAFKPHARGFLHACAVWGIEPDRVAYVGDRPDVDAIGAANAGMRCLIVGRGNGHASATYERVLFPDVPAAVARPPAAAAAARVP